MPLIKTAAGITDITGRVGGTIFKRDSSGLHMTAKSKYVHKPKSQKQIDQNNWYCQLKREESVNGPPKPEDEKPKDKATVLFYQLYSMQLAAVNTLTQPTAEEHNATPEQADLLYEWVEFQRSLWQLIPGMTLQLAYRFLWRIIIENQYTWGLVYTEAVADAKVFFLDRCTAWGRVQRIAFYGSVSFIGLAFFVVFSVVAFFQKRYGTLRLPLTAGVIYLNEQWFFASMIARPSFRMYDFAIGPPLPIVPTCLSLEQPGRTINEYSLDFSNTVQTVTTFSTHYQTNTWQSMKIWSRWPLYIIRPNVYRAAFKQDYTSWVGVPVGWTYAGDPFSFINNIYLV